MSPKSGRALKEDNTVVNEAEMLEAIYHALVIMKDAGITLSGSNLPLVAGIAEIGIVPVSGSNVEIGGVSFAVSGGDTLRNTAANKPDAAAAHAAIPFCYYHAIDTGTVEATDGTNWVVI